MLLRPDPKILLFRWEEGIRKGPRKNATNTALVIIALKRVLPSRKHLIVSQMWVNVDM